MASSSSNGVLNGNAHYAESSNNAYSSAPNSNPPSPDTFHSHHAFHIHDQQIVDHIFHSGFQSGNYADTILHVHKTAFRLHAIIISRSPYLAHLMSTSPQANPLRTIYINLEAEPQVTPQGFTIALSYLYSSQAIHQVQPGNARAVLAAACLLGGMDDLCQYALEMCKTSISPESISEWVDFVDTIPVLRDQSADLATPPSVFGQYAHILRDYVFDYLVVTLPSILATPGNPEGRDRLLQIYSRIPFDMFKAAVESPCFKTDLPDTVHTRFKFVKDCIEVRKRGMGRGTGGEETVVLAFGGENGGGVHVTRKVRRRALWKVNS